MCTMLAHTCVVVVHVFMFIGSKSAPLPSCGSIVLQMACNCFISPKPVECFSDFQKSCSQLRGCTTSMYVCHWVYPGREWVYWSAKMSGEGSVLSIEWSG